MTGSRVMTIFVYKGGPEIQKLETPSSEFCPISEDWGELVILNVGQMFFIKCY